MLGKMRTFHECAKESPIGSLPCRQHQLISSYAGRDVSYQGSTANMSKRWPTVFPPPLNRHDPRPLSIVFSSSQTRYNSSLLPSIPNLFQISGLPSSRKAPYGIAGVGQDKLRKRAETAKLKESASHAP